jgi:TonB family protein
MKKNYGILGTILFHGILVLIIMFLGFSTPLPLPEEEGILINFGTDDFGLGETEPAYSELPDEQEFIPQEEEYITETDKEEILTQDYEESVAVEEKKVTTETQPVKKEVVTETVTETQPEEITQPVVEEKKVNERALYKGRSSTSETTGSEGITQEDGNQGGVTGSPDSDNYSSGLSQGSGGIEFSLAGRNPLFLPKPKYEYQVEGKVVVEIRVDRNGNVTYARAGVKGSTTNDENLIKAAQEAALKARFDSKPDAAFTQTGTITYHFILQ